jgi:hypothetical protein
MNTTLRASHALAALAVALVASFAPVAAQAQSASGNDTVVVPRITKGSSGNLIRVKRNSADARRYFASIAQSKASRSALCPGTICVKTTTCHTTKGALGAGCITK